jgi:hypothetical protein
LLASDATDILRKHSTDLLFNHSIRVYLFAAEQGRRQKLRFDAGLLYVAAAFHDFGPLKKYSSPNERFEVDGANAARQFLSTHNLPEDHVQTVWEAIALHPRAFLNTCAPKCHCYIRALAWMCLEKNSDQFPPDLRDKIVTKYPRRNFKEDFIQAYFAGFAHKPASTYGTVNAAIWIHPRLQEPQRQRLDRCIALSGFRVVAQ